MELIRKCTTSSALLVILFVALGIATPPQMQAATLPTPFIVFNNTRFTNRSLLDSAGTLRSVVVYDVWGLTCSATACSNVPSEAAFQSEVQAYVSQYGSKYLLVFDFEHIVVDDATSQGQADQEVALFKQFLKWTRAILPNTRIGMYDYDWTSGPYNSTRAQLFQDGGFDFFAPSMYQRWSTHAIWDANLSAAVANDRAISATLPIYPYISPYPSGNTNSTTFLSDSEWTAELSDLSTRTNGAILWSGYATIDTSSDWYTELLSTLSPSVSTGAWYTIKNEHNGLCVDDYYQGTGDGTEVNQYTCGGAGSTDGSQAWQFQPDANGLYSVTNQLAISELWNVANSGTDNGSLINLYSAGSGGPGTSQTWRVVSLSHNYHMFVDLASERCITVPSIANGAQLEIYDCTPVTTQFFSLTPASASATAQLVTETTLAAESDGSYQATVTVTNSGGGTAQNVVLTGMSLGSASGTSIPQTFGSIAPGGYATTTVSVPVIAGAPGNAVVGKVIGIYTGGTFGGSFRAKLP